ncbi:phage holin, lambda family [Halomonas sp. HP20-15]|uniref:phage holin, lambda family n=1 Tax=Halomonas sp. HP20-15 TaxID=3085901 RepID=UPI002981BD5A|nr:phage holin, lambda family [Halomonas sp. HP20-15]MDW5376825.1 phage holin, lambda family [Halomonas sp. HP20-15]
MTHQYETHPMPAKDPNNWGWLLELLASIWPQLYAAGLAFLVALVRALYAGGKPFKALLEAILCGCLTLALVPVLNHFGLSPDLAVAFGAAVAFLGVEWLRDRAGAIAEKVIGRWLGK